MKKTNKNHKGDVTMTVLTAKCDRAFIVAPKKSKHFLEHKTKSFANQEKIDKIVANIEIVKN